MDLSIFSTPAVVVDRDIMERNISCMVKEAAKYGIAHRPHVKAHKSIELAKLQGSMGAKGVTCAKLGEAEVLEAGGIDDILIAFPMIGEEKLRRYGALSEKCTLRSIVNSVSGARGLSELGVSLGKRMEVLIELDGGTGRGGIGPFEPTLVFAQSIQALPGIKIVGLLSYPGLAYNEETKPGIEKAARRERDEMIGTAELLRANGFDIQILSGGNTPTSKVPHCLEGITEIRSGNYIFNDCAQLYPGHIGPEDCAMRVVSTVVCRPDESSAIIDAGSKALTSDSFPSSAGRYGFVVGHEEVELFKLNEEHGFLRSRGSMPFEIGDRIEIIPNHACVVSNLNDEIYSVKGGAFSGMIRIDARGKNG